MALDYLTIPGTYICILIYHSLIVFAATSVNVKRVFSRGHLLLLHVRSRLSAETTHAPLCLGCWSLLGLVKDKDVLPVTRLADIEGEEPELEDGWDSIVLV
jgi:hypothetical protein